MSGKSHSSGRWSFVIETVDQSSTVDEPKGLDLEVVEKALDGMVCHCLGCHVKDLVISALKYLSVVSVDLSLFGTTLHL